MASATTRATVPTMAMRFWRWTLPDGGLGLAGTRRLGLDGRPGLGGQVVRRLGSDGRSGSTTAGLGSGVPGGGTPGGSVSFTGSW